MYCVALGAAVLARTISKAAHDLGLYLSVYHKIGYSSSLTRLHASTRRLSLVQCVCDVLCVWVRERCEERTAVGVARSTDRVHFTNILQYITVGILEKINIALEIRSPWKLLDTGFCPQ